MVVKKVRFISVPFPLVLMGRSISTDGTCSVASVNMIFIFNRITGCTIQKMVVIPGFSTIHPDMFMFLFLITADGAVIVEVIAMGDCPLFSTAIADHCMI
jgi:hypothetical protein